MLEPYSVIIILLITTILFVWGKFRYDVVALIALMISVMVGAVPFDKVYSGLSNPAVITVACVMIISETIILSGTLIAIVRGISKIIRYPVIHIGVLTLIAAICSAFMNNVGALGLMMPVAIQTAKKAKRSPSILLMPIALGSALGGLTTVIGTPPNLLISAYRAEITGKPFAMFDFGYVGFWIALAGVIFISFIGWRLLPKRKKTADFDKIFEIDDYITELKVTDRSPIANHTVMEFETLLDEDYLVIGIIRNNRKRLVIRPHQQILANDIIILEASSEVLQEVVNKTKLEVVGDQRAAREILQGEDISLSECVIPQGSNLEGRSPQQLRLRSRYQINLLAISRQGKPFKDRMSQVKLHGGDVILLQGPNAALQDTIARLNLLPLAPRNIQVGSNKLAYLPLLIFAIAILCAALQLLPVEIAFGGAVLVMLLSNIIPARKVYDMVEWPIILLLAAMIPIGQALQSTGGTGLIAHYFTSMAGHVSPTIILGLLMLVTMTLSDFMNNAATAVVMAPIAVSIAQAMGLNIDTFLMGTSIAASCSFLTPVGHQNNTLVMGPGGYKFTDYIRIGLPLEIIVLLISIPLLVHYFPFT